MRTNRGILAHLNISEMADFEKIAIQYKDTTYSFRQIIEYARRLASITSCHEKKPIIVFSDRSAEVIIYFLAVIFSGNFYVPIDPDSPISKIESIFSDCQPEFIFGNEEYKHIVKDLRCEKVFYTINDMTETLCDYPATQSDDPLYMIYTSGSTGKPKGVIKSHGAMMDFIDAYTNTFSFSVDEVIGNQTPFFFDAAAKDIYLMLKTGATLEILPTELFMMPPQLVEYMNERKVTTIFWVPSALSIISQLKTFLLIKPLYLKKIFFVGEVMPIKHLNYWRENLPDAQFVNLYGQSELAGICCYYEVIGNFENTEKLPIGKPLENCKIYLMDNQKVIEEQDHIGEMYIVSKALATEYYHDLEKNEKCFVHKDFGDGLVRCFKTGDLAQYDVDMNLIFSSRNDDQIKHMGHRIELGEIETIAGSLPEIQVCCCVYNHLCSKIELFVQLTPKIKKTGREIKSLLKPVFVSYMLPSKVHVMEKLPLNANGKIDRKKLKEML